MRWKELDRRDVKSVKTFPYYIYYPEATIKYDPTKRFITVNNAERYIDSIKTKLSEECVIEI